MAEVFVLWMEVRRIDDKSLFLNKKDSVMVKILQDTAMFYCCWMRRRRSHRRNSHNSEGMDS